MMFVTHGNAPLNEVMMGMGRCVTYEQEVSDVK